MKKYLSACYFGAKVQSLKPIPEQALIDYKRIEYFEETQQYNAKNVIAYLNYKFKSGHSDCLALLA